MMLIDPKKLTALRDRRERVRGVQGGVAGRRIVRVAIAAGISPDAHSASRREVASWTFDVSAMRIAPFGMERAPPPGEALDVERGRGAGWLRRPRRPGLRPSGERSCSRTPLP